jgi:hypothetical protein
MKYVQIFVFLLFFNNLKAQRVNPDDCGLKAFAIEDKELGLINFYVDTTNIHKKAPLFIETNGSGGHPLAIFIKGNNFGYGTTITLNYELMNKTREKYHHVIIGKPGTPFCDSVRINQNKVDFDANIFLHDYVENFTFSAEYTKRMSLQWRVDATKKVIDYLIKRQFWNKTKIIAYGYSEGGQVVPTLAVEDKRITHVVPVVGSGLNQLYDDIISWRIKASKGEVTHQQAQDSINAALNIIRDMYKYPTDVDKETGGRGHSYQRWASFGSKMVFEQLRKLTIPIYMIVGTADNNSPIYGLDYVLLDFIRLGKTNLIYDPCVGCNHYLNSVENGKEVSHFNDYVQKVLAWIDKN